MTAPADIKRKFRQLDNDVHAIYGKLDEISAGQRGHGKRLDGIDGRLDGIDGRLDGIDGRLEQMDQRLSGRLDGIDGRLDGIDGRLDGVNGQLEQILNVLGSGR
ncbi:MAG: hypothetical protein DLM55_08220 [Acidimicrobiales bacterium]|nr:MAG: hypothetical protein DLM55_08220 [Acidimicrobiales bacterium]